MTRTAFARMLIGGSGLVVGALFVFGLRGAALSGAQRLEVAQTRGKAIVAASAPGAQTVAAGASYPRM